MDTKPDRGDHATQTKVSRFPAYDAAYREFFSDPKPARTTVGSTLAGILVELDVVAYAG